MDGFLNLNKPLGRSSGDLVVSIRRQLPRGTKIGHGGTLDPEASGVLPICIGKATRLFDYIIDKEKTYLATLALGIVTDTQDATGTVLEEKPVMCGRDELPEAFTHFVGEIDQIPPMYSAVKKDGKRLYALARQGKTVDVSARRCRVWSIGLAGEPEGNRYPIRIRCGKGVYIRTLCHDIGAYLGCGAHMASLIREQAGIFRIEDALTPDQAEELIREGSLEDVLLPLDAPLQHLSRIDVGPEAEHAVRNGNPLTRRLYRGEAVPGDSLRIYLSGKFCGIGEADEEGVVRFRAMLL